MCVWIANKFAKFYAKRRNRSENILKKVLERGGGYFFETPGTWKPTLQTYFQMELE